jgi:hypothetical protein
MFIQILLVSRSLMFHVKCSLNIVTLFVTNLIMLYNVYATVLRVCFIGTV